MQLTYAAGTLSQSEIKAINKLVEECCNYLKSKKTCSSKYMPCMMIDKLNVRLFCKWFKDCVLPINTELRSVLIEKAK